MADESRDAVRVDRWLWGVRVFKTRAFATEACRGGHVRVNDTSAKPATPVRSGDRVTAQVHGRKRLLEVVRVVDKRVGASVAADCMIDHTPPSADGGAPQFARERGAGRPTKRDRRDLDQLRRR